MCLFAPILTAPTEVLIGGLRVVCDEVQFKRRRVLMLSFKNFLIVDLIRRVTRDCNFKKFFIEG